MQIFPELEHCEDGADTWLALVVQPGVAIVAHRLLQLCRSIFEEN